MTTDLKAQKRMAADVLDVGESRVWFDPGEQTETAETTTHEDICELIDKGTIHVEDAKGNSKDHAREHAAKHSYGHRKGAGSRKGHSGARQNKKDAWVSRIRARRRRLKELREDGTLDRFQYCTFYNRASGGEFDSVDRLEAYIQNNYQVEVQ